MTAAVEHFVAVRSGVVHHITCTAKRAEVTLPWTPSTRDAADRACLLCMPGGLPAGQTEGWE